MKKTSAKPAAKKRETKNKTLSNVVKPENMGLREWQIRLRKQAAVKDALVVSSVDRIFRPGEYEVRNCQTRKVYNVAYYGTVFFG